MALEIPKISYNGVIKEIPLGKEATPVIVGGETCYPFYLFEGEMPHPPRIAMEVYDALPEEWPQAALEPFADVINDPAAWAQKCVYHTGQKWWRYSWPAQTQMPRTPRQNRPWM